MTETVKIRVIFKNMKSSFNGRFPRRCRSDNSSFQIIETRLRNLHVRFTAMEILPMLAMNSGYLLLREKRDMFSVYYETFSEEQLKKLYVMFTFITVDGCF